MATQIPSAATSPGPPVKHSPSPSTATAAVNDNPYNVDLVIPYSIALSSKDLKDRPQAEAEIKYGYESLLRALEGARFRVATKGGRGQKGSEEVWVFVGASDDRVNELVEDERRLDASHNLPTPETSSSPSPATRLRLIYNVLTSPAIQGGLGITPARGKWARVKSITALHDEAADKAWIEKWTTGGDWQVGLTKGLDKDTQKGGLGDQQPPPVHLYFDFLTTYTLSLLPLTVVSVLFYLFTPADSYPPLYALVLSIYSSVFVAIWRVKQRKFAVRFGTTGCESVAVGRLRPEYVSSLGLDKATSEDDTPAIDAVPAGGELKRDTKVMLSVPIIAACGLVLGVVLMGIFVLEAFVGQVYDGYGKEVVPLIPTGLFALLVPQIVAAYNTLAQYMISWENHPTPVSEEKSLTAKTFAMNAIVAYLGLYLSAYVYVPFGSHIMGNVQDKLGERGWVVASTTGEGEGGHGINGGRLKSQLFAYTVTNQAVNAFLELGLPYILRFINEWRAGKTTIKSALKGTPSPTEEKVKEGADGEERKFLDKVERELELPEYNLFTDYAEMVTQFGHVTIWSIVWPLAPVFALLNNYVELRSDALKICKHVRRPVGDRVETIGSWLETLGIISWIGAITNSTLIYLFRPSPSPLSPLTPATVTPPSPSSQSPDSNFPVPGSPQLSHLVTAFHASPSFSAWYPNLVTLLLVGLGASHGYIVLRWLVEGVVERVWWRGSWEEKEMQRKSAGSGSQSQSGAGFKRNDVIGKQDGPVHPFWNGGEEGAREISRLIKAE